MEIDTIKRKYRLCRYVKHKTRPYIIFYAWSQTTRKLERQRVYHPPHCRTGHDRSRWRNGAMSMINKMLEAGYVFTSHPPEKVDTSQCHRPAVLRHFRVTPSGPSIPSGIIPALEWALGSRTKEIRDTTRDCYRNVIQRLGEYLAGSGSTSMGIKAFTKAHVAGFSEWLYNGRGVGTTTRNNYLSYLRSLFGSLLDAGAISTNPFDKFRKAKQDAPSRNVALSAVQVQRLTEWMDVNDRPLLLVCRMMYYTFARPVELYRLKVGDIDLDAGVMHMSASITKSRKSAQVKLPAPAVAMLRPLVDGSDPAFHLIGHDGRPHRHQVNRDTFGRRHMAALRACGVTGAVTLYSWKHTGVCAAFDRGMELEEISKRCRHSDMRITEIYLRDLRKSRPKLEISEW